LLILKAVLSMSDLLVQKVKSSVAAAVVTVVAIEVDSVADAADSVVVKEETTSVAVVAIEVTILDLLMATILREVEREEVAKAASDLPEAATPLPKSD
jgi:hypothetical protein